jgi:hypothetical protein
MRGDEKGETDDYAYYSNTMLTYEYASCIRLRKDNCTGSRGGLYT